MMLCQSSSFFVTDWSRFFSISKLLVLHAASHRRDTYPCCMRGTEGGPSCQQMMAMFNRQQLQVASVVCIIFLLMSYYHIFYTCPGEITTDIQDTQKQSLAASSPVSSSAPCSCPAGSVLLKDHLPKDQTEELLKRRAKELQQHKARTASVLSTLLLAEANSPLQYPIQGFIVQPRISTLIPGLMLKAEGRELYKLSLNVSKGVLTTGNPPEGVTIKGDSKMELVVESNSLESLNNLLATVTFTSSNYHIHTGDLAFLQFEDHKAVFPITIKQPIMPVLYDMGTEISSQVTITTKTFLRYPNLNVLLSSIRKFYSKINVIIADDSFEPQKITGEHIQHYIMPPAQGWFAGRNLAVSQVTTKYFLWVDDDFVFTENTKIEKLVEVMEAVPELDVVGGSVKGNQFYFSLIYQEGDEMEGGCLNRKSSGKFQPLPGFPHCSVASGVVNFFLARTDAARKVGFDPKLQRVAHSEFFMDGMGSLMVASCNHVSIGHQPHTSSKDSARYQKFRHPGGNDEEFKLRLHFFKNNLKCIRYG